ncbi:MAG: fimbria major subunit [Bacteroides sp.]|nr:fimbria major subunit [Bacteroides sp.]
MNNVTLTTRVLPVHLLDWENYSSVESPFHLSDKNNKGTPVDNSSEVYKDRGAVEIERSVARFDFKDGSKIGGNRYNVLLNTNEDGDFVESKPIVDVEIQKMCLVNMSNKFYYLPRVSPTGQSKDYTLCGSEKPWFRNANGTYSGGNYVVGPYADIFGGNAVMSGFSTYFNFPFFEDNGSFNNEEMSSNRWDVVKVDDVLNNTKDNYIQPGIEDAESGQYRIWRYVTENVIPEDNAKQMNGISTGVVFKGKLLGSTLADSENPGYYEEDWNKGDIKNLANCLNGKSFTYDGNTHTLKGNSKEDPILYYYSGHLYMGWRHIRQAAIQASVTISAAGNVEINRSNSLYKAVFGDGPIPTYTDSLGVHNMVYVTPDSTYTINDPMWKTANDNTSGDEYQGYLKSANYAWSQWALNGKEVGDDATGANSSDALNGMRKAVTDAGITIYQSSKDDDYGAGYYCYYYYWNRHNDNGLNGSMGPMEFDVVRNNVYKLSIDKIARLGHPRIPENDPNNPTPDDPDESDEIYLDVRVKIVPWSVRLNSIEF